MDRIQQSVERTNIRLANTYFCYTFRLVSEPDEIKNKFHHIMSNEISSNVENIYGDGKTGEKIVKLLNI